MKHELSIGSCIILQAIRRYKHPGKTTVENDSWIEFIIKWKETPLLISLVLFSSSHKCPWLSVNVFEGSEKQGYFQHHGTNDCNQLFLWNAPSGTMIQPPTWHRLLIGLMTESIFLHWFCPRTGWTRSSVNNLYCAKVLLKTVPKNWNLHTEHI